MAMSPVLDAAAKAAGRDLNGNAAATATATRTAAATTPRKTKKTIINWLVNSDSDNNNRSTCDKANKDIQNQNTNQKPNTQPNPNQNCSCESRAFRDFRGVQTLRLLWSKRIKSASEDHSHATASSSSLGTLKKLNKSVSCLVNAFNNSRDCASPEKTLAKRAASLHNLHDSHTKQLRLQRDKDNFYKYKNAEQAKMQAKLRSNADEAILNASETRAKRDDSSDISPTKQYNMAALSAVDKVAKDGGQEGQEEEEEERVELRAKRERNRLERFSLSAASAQSGGSSESLQTTTSSSATPNTVTSSTGRSGGRRKYSFKTHAGKSYHQHHHPTRRLTNMDSHSSSGGNISLVTKLTHQFNEIIQKDARLLEQVKRNNGVWLSRGTHVYKIVEKSSAEGKGSQTSEENRISTVQRNIKKFERLEKPSVPIKSEHLIRKHLEQMKASNLPRGPRIKRNLKLPPGSVGIPELAVVSEEQKTPNLTNSAEQAKQPKSSTTETESLPSNSSNQQELNQTNGRPRTSDELDSMLGEEEAEEDLRQKQRKHKYASIYEKLRFTFAKGRKSASPSPTKGRSREEISIDEESLPKENIVQGKAPKEEGFAEETPTQKINRKEDFHLDIPREVKARAEDLEDPSQPLLISPCMEADAKILDALEALDQKLKVLNPLNEAAPENGERELLLAANDDFEQRILPNSSFVYQAANKQISNNQILLNQAVNVTLVNAIEGEQMIMEQKQLMKVIEEEDKLKDQGLQKEGEILEPESIYEPITPVINETKTETPASSLFKIYAKKSEIVEDIYQTVEEAAIAKAKPNNWLEGYESIAGSQEACTSAYDGYESFAQEEVLLTPTTPSGTGTLGRNTRDELPELPKPKRVLNKSPMPLRPAPPKPEPKESEEDENIYDTIKGCYESMHCKAPTSSSGGGATLPTDAISLGSNCYESITHFRKTRMAMGQNQAPGSAGSCIQLSSSGSTLTISSDHKTNSLYESSLAATGCVAYGSASVGCRSSLGSSAGSREGGKPGDKRSSIAGSSDNSDAWVDISDGEIGQATMEAAANEAQFIVVRERFKPHRTRSPDWSKRIRDKRLQQKKAISCIEDDSDHYYETLSPLGNKRHSTQLVRHGQNTSGNGGMRSSHRRSKNHTASAHTLGEHVVISADYDSFESDSDDHGDGEPNQRLRNHNDSGVDMRNHRLPKPPPPPNQVYEFVRKFRDFISSKKSPKGSQQKLYENTPAATQFYVESAKRTEEVYENTEYGPERSPAPTGHQETAPVLRAKQKNAKSLRSRLRKSLVGSSFDTKQLSSLAATRSTFYVEDPEGSLPALPLEPEMHGSGELDSGFSEKHCTPTAESQKFSTVARKAKKEVKASRRRTTIGLRPHDPPPPPPPPPLAGSKSPTDTERGLESGETPSWYAECGVFKQAPNATGSARVGDEPVTPTPSGHGGVSSWYAESGLYQTSGISVASSSGSSGVSTGNEAGLGDELSSEPHSLFSNEPLYQMYSAAKLESITRDLEAHGSSDGYEEIGQHAKAKPEPLAKTRPTALQLVEPKNGPSRTLWSEIPEVIHSCILPTLTSRERSLQEAKFEIITSEASYLKSLNLLRRHFMNHSAFVDTSVLSAKDRKALFSYIVPVHECSERLLTELEACWQDNIMLLGLSRCIYEIAERHFHVYVAFCEHQGRMDRALRRLKESKESLAFQQHLERLEANSSCCGLNLHSFLMLPMQRITRLPLLIDAVFSKESPLNREEYEGWKLTLALVQKIVGQCNEAANRWEQAFELERIASQLEFPAHVRALAIAPVGVPRAGAKPRFLVKRGELTHLVWRGEDAKLTFGKRLTKASIYAFLFSDLLLLCKRRGESSFSVLDYCPRSMLTLAAGDSLPQLPTKDLKDQAGKNLILMTLLENSERKTVELVLSCPSVSDQQRWLQAMRPPEAETPGEKLYESWDCPQVVAKHSYEIDEPDVLQLELGDVVNVSRKLPDGWYQGERIRDGAVGWFPGSYTEELNSAHVRARNLKQRHRLLTFTATYLESQKAK
ncbi:uncharacterized protein LOC108048822 isoform X1 [Drosophila rhopaloa]|uniref:Ephexin-1 n=1 Tax=Drosophila rhopaloa TaxID=1041015 RepID=A0ABM5HTJ1_DRORH|nr:uncharacterized protein LOC108048822 isoform X1 [Drosophila rhopaloa]XP_016985216.2 uncharacterized protein LOC108048822 isoform X1 [Drosophila rhopaloa]